MTRDEIEVKLADYALGEVTDAERAEIERALEADPALRARLAELEGAAFAMAAAGAPGPVLAPAVREALIADAVRAALPAKKSRWGWPVGLAAAALLAGIAGGLLGGTHYRDRVKPPPPVARSEKPATRTTRAPFLTKDVISGEFPGSGAFTIEPNEMSEKNIAGISFVAGFGGLPPGKYVRVGEVVYAVDTGVAIPVRGDLGYVRDYDIEIAQNSAIADIEFGSNWSDDTSKTAEYSRIVDNTYFLASRDPLSTFSIDVDTFAYANVRRFLNSGQVPPPDAVRIEELVNYFRYDYVPPAGSEPMSVAAEVQQAPWEPKHRLVRIGVQAKAVETASAPAANLVFLVDVSGSMGSAERLPLVKESLRLLVERLRAEDRVSMVVYAGNSGLALPSTSGAQKAEILAAIDRLDAGGSTNGGEGIELAYKTAAENFIQGGVNRVILCTDGDFNVGIASEGDLTRLIEEKRKTGVFLSVLGYGTDNLADSRMQALADKGNGNASYIDSLKEAEKVLVEEATGTLMTVAKDVKIQVEFNPARVAAYRLIGYENRVLAAQDFNDDTKDAGEVGAGHQVTALYEIVPVGEKVPAAGVDELRYQKPASLTESAATDELLAVKVRYKLPDSDVSRMFEETLRDSAGGTMSLDFQFAAAVAAFGMEMRHSPYKGQTSLALVEELARGGLGNDASGRRAEFVELVRKARELAEKAGGK